MINKQISDTCSHSSKILVFTYRPDVYNYSSSQNKATTRRLISHDIHSTLPALVSTSSKMVLDVGRENTTPVPDESTSKESQEEEAPQPGMYLL